MLYSAERRIAKLENNRASRLVGEGTDDGAVWARFELRANVVSFRSKKRGMTDASRNALVKLDSPCRVLVLDRRRGADDGNTSSRRNPRGLSLVPRHAGTLARASGSNPVRLQVKACFGLARGTGTRLRAQSMPSAEF